MFTKLKSSDGELFSVANTFLQKSETLKSMLNLCSEEMTDDVEDVVTLDKIHSKYLKIVVHWLEVGTLDTDDLEQNDLHHLIVHSNYLNIPGLLDELCKMLVEQIAKKKNLTIQDDLITKPRCFHDRCKATSVENLKVCVKCSIAKYCSKDCQSDDWAEHKQICKLISSLTKAMKREAAHLSQFVWDEPGNTFEEEAGHFWGIHETRPYCRAKCSLAEAIMELAKDKKQSFIYEKSLSHHMELLRLIHGDNMGIRYMVPATFLILNKDEECHNFLKWWCTIDPHGTYDWGDVPQSKEGDWLYLTNQDLYEDPLLFTDFHELQSLNAFLCIRLRIVSRFRLMEAINTDITDAISSGDELKPLIDVLPSLQKIALGEKSTSKNFTLGKQEEILQNILVAIKETNKSFLPAFLNPKPLFANDPPSSYSRGSTSETYFALKSCLSVLSSISIAKDVISAFCGNDTSYDAKVVSFY